jgi:hypothetical protein
MAVCAFDRRMFACALICVLLVVTGSVLAQTSPPPKAGLDPASAPIQSDQISS